MTKGLRIDNSGTNWYNNLCILTSNDSDLYLRRDFDTAPTQIKLESAQIGFFD